MVMEMDMDAQDIKDEEPVLRILVIDVWPVGAVRLTNIVSKPQMNDANPSIRPLSGLLRANGQ